MLESLFDGLTAILSGGATGLLGTVISGVLGHFKAKQDLKREITLRELDIQLARIEGDSAENIAAIEAEGARDEAAWKAIDASYREAARRWSRPGDGWAMVFVDVVRGLIRPALTVGLFALVGAIYFSLAASADPSVAKIQARIVDTALYMATAAGLWWFGQRPTEKAMAGMSGRAR